MTEMQLQTSMPFVSDFPRIIDTSEWYTPPHIIDAARYVLGGIDLDPSSCAAANEVVKATTYYTREQDGLSLPWSGRVWLNPPYGRGVIDKFVFRLLEEIRSGSVERAILLTNNCTDTEWWQAMANEADAVCFLRSRTNFWGPLQGDKSPGARQGQTIAFLHRTHDPIRTICDRVSHFVRVFGEFGIVFE